MDRVETYLQHRCRKIARQIMAWHLKRPITSKEHVRHLDNDPFNNSLKNLQIIATDDNNIIPTAGKKSPKPFGWKPANAVSETTIKDILRMRRDGLSYSKIAIILGISDATVRRYAKMNAV